MKTLVLSTLIAVATAGSAYANHTTKPRIDRIKGSELTEKIKRIDAFKSQLAFHQRNVEVLWNQYQQATDRLRNERGNHAELDRDEAYFTGVYQEDIDNNLRVEESMRAIAEIKANYEQARADREAYEGKHLFALQNQLKVELKKEAKKFKKAKRKNAELVNTETLPMLQEVEHVFAQSIERAKNLTVYSDGHTIAAR